MSEQAIGFEGQKRLLSLDGGGMLGLMTLMILKKIETDLAAAHGRSNDFRLCEFFDYFAGTSTGAIIAAGLAVGKSVDELITLYRDKAEKIFDKDRLFFLSWRHRYNHEGLLEELSQQLSTKSVQAMHEDGDLKSLLLVPLRNATTDSPWLVSSNPRDPFAGALGALPLYQVVRASTAAPYYFAPQEIVVPDHRPGKPPNKFSFEDGGVTAYNNPSLALFRHATLKENWSGAAESKRAVQGPWPVGEDKLLLVSVGTGETKQSTYAVHEGGARVWKTVTKVPSNLMSAISTENDISCRTLGRCAFGPEIDFRYGRLMRQQGDGVERLFRYVRYNPEMSGKGFKDLTAHFKGSDRSELKKLSNKVRFSLDNFKFESIDPDSMTMESIDKLDEMTVIGAATAVKTVDVNTHFAGFLPKRDNQTSPPEAGSERPLAS